MCCTGPAWKREVVPDHKFDFIDTRDYHTKNFAVRVQYIWVYVLVVKAFLVYLSDIYTAVTYLSSKTWTNKIYDSCQKGENDCFVSFEVGKWIFVGCILFSFLLLAYESRKAKKIIASRDISYAFTNIMANNYYSLRSYNHFCFFAQIENSTKKKDDFAFFVFFTFKEWKRVCLADGPRQCINCLTLYSFWVANGRGNPFEKISEYYDGSYVTAMLLVTMVFTVLIWIGSVLLLIVAAIAYVPLLCYIRGNLKEYCCHKVDKRIAELIKKKTQQRVQRQAALAKKEAAGDFSHLKGKNGTLPANLPQQPTLPSVSVDDDLPSVVTRRSKGLDDMYWHPDGKSDYAASTHGGTNPTDYHDYPPMPAYYNPPYGEPQPAESLYGHDDPVAYRPQDDPYHSTSNLAYNAAPYAGHEYPGRDQYYDQQYPQQYDQQQQYGYADDGYSNGGHPPQSKAPSYSSHDPKGGAPAPGGGYAM